MGISTNPKRNTNTGTTTSYHTVHERKTMGVSSWFYTNTARNKVVKIVHPGGHAELHDRPILASDIIRRNPRCCVAHPNVFQQPWAIVAPDTTLMPGQKFYVVPISTIRKLQQLSLKHHPSLVQDPQNSQSSEVEGEDDGILSACSWLIVDNKLDPKDESCFICFKRGVKTKINGVDSSKEGKSSSSVGSSEGNKEVAGKKRKKNGGSPKRHASLDCWQPNLESVTEEINN